MKLRNTELPLPTVPFGTIKRGEVFGFGRINSAYDLYLKIEPMEDPTGNEYNVARMDDGDVFFCYDEIPVIKLHGEFVLD